MPVASVEPVESLKCPRCGGALKSRYQTRCQYCGAGVIIYEDSEKMPEDPLITGIFDRENVWLFTDTVAKAHFQFKGRIKELRHDIRFNVMRGTPWQKEELEYVSEIKRLKAQGVIEEKEPTGGRRHIRRFIVRKVGDTFE